MKFTQQDLEGLNLNELGKLNDMVITAIKARRIIEGASVKNDLRVKQEVKIDHPEHRDTIFIIDKINKTTASVTIKGTNKAYKVNFSMIITKW